MDEVRITLRLPTHLRDELQARAEINSRSMNGEIVARLDYSLNQGERDAAKIIVELTDITAERDRLRGELERMTLEQAARVTPTVDGVEAALRALEERYRLNQEQADRMIAMLQSQIEIVRGVFDSLQDADRLPAELADFTKAMLDAGHKSENLLHTVAEGFRRGREKKKKGQPPA